MSVKDNPKIQKYLELAQAALKKEGGRITKARLLVLQVIAEATIPLNHKEILQKIKKNDRTQIIDPVSIYRILEVLIDLGLVHKMGNGFLPCTHSSCQTSHHIFLICNQCRITQEIHLPEKEVQFIYGQIHQSNRFQVSHAVMNMSGLCEACLNQNELS